MKFGRTIGLDIESREVRVLQLSRWGPWVKVRAAERIRLPEAEEEARLILRRVAEARGWTRWPCVVGLHGEATLLRVLAIPGSDTRPLALAVGDRMQAFRSISSGRTVEEFALIREHNRNRMVLAGLTRMDHLQDMLARPEAARLRIVSAIPRPLAVFHAATHLAPRRFGAFAVVHLGHAGTDILAGSGKMPVFVRRFSTGADHLTGEPAGDGVLPWPAPPAAWQGWLEELASCLDVFRTEHPGRRMRPAQIILCGVRPLPAEAIQAVAEKIQVPVESLDGARRARKMPQAGAYAAALGLALAGVGKAPLTLSLLPARVKEKLALRWQFKYWLGGSLAATGAMLVVMAGLQRQTTADERQIEIRRHMLNERQQQDAVFQEFRARNEALRKQLRPLRDARDNGALVGRILEAAARAKDRNDWITLLADADSYFLQGIPGALPPREGVRPAAAERRREGAGIDHVVIEGYTPAGDLSTVRTMIEALRAHPGVASVDLLGDDKVAAAPMPSEHWSLANVRRFAIEIKLRTPPTS